MKRLIVAVLLLTAAITCRAAEVGSLRCEYLADPLGIDAMRPRLSWVVSSSLRGDRQTAYRVLVASSPELLARGEGDLWDSGKTASGRSIQVEYGGKPLAGLAKCYWKVRVWDADDRPSRWSEPARWSMGPLCEEDWGGAEWIAARDEETWRNEWAEHKRRDVENREPNTWPWFVGTGRTIWDLYENASPRYDPSPLMRKEFSVGRKVVSADLYVCGLGYYEAYLNGRRVGDHVLDPAWTNFHKRAFYVTYDVTGMIRRGGNAIGIMLGRGQYSPICTDIWGLYRSKWVGQPKAIALLAIRYSDGTTERIVTDESWRTAGGPVVYDDTRHGELYDARLEQDGWSDGIKVISYGGTFVPDSGGVKVKIGSLSLSAGIKTDGKHGKVCGWIRVPAELLPETDNTWTGDNNGKYPLPQASLSGNGRGRCAVMPARTHTRSRWPLPDIYTPAADFRDNPEAYLVYFEWTPEGSEEKADPDEFRDTDRAPAGLSYGISSGISGLERSPAFAGKSDRRTYSLDFSKGTGLCTVGSGISFAIKTEKSGQTPALTVLADNTGAGGRGLRAIFGTGGRLNVAFSGGKPEITVFDGYIGYDIFDGEWHTFRLENSFGKYALVIDGIVVTCDGFDAAADEYCSGNALSLRLSGSGGLSVGVRAEGKKTAGTIEPVQEKLPAKKPDAAAILCIAAAVMAAAAAITVVVGRRKETSTFFERK